MRQLKDLNQKEKKALLEYLTRERIKVLWATPEASYDCLLEKEHGDGGQLVYLQTMDSRPFYYLIRVDSSLDLEKEYHEILSEDSECYFDEMLMRMIEDEHDNIFRYEETEAGLYTSNQDEEEGIEPFEYKWPMFSLGAGHSYGAIDIDFYLKEMERQPEIIEI